MKHNIFLNVYHCFYHQQLMSNFCYYCSLVIIWMVLQFLETLFFYFCPGLGWECLWV